MKYLKILFGYFPNDYSVADSLRQIWLIFMQLPQLLYFDDELQQNSLIFWAEVLWGFWYIQASVWKDCK